MAKNKWLFISLATAILMIAGIVGFGCNFLGVARLRGNGAAALGLTYAVGIAASVVTFVLQYIKNYSTSPYFWRGIILIPIFLFIYAATIESFAKQYCHK